MFTTTVCARYAKMSRHSVVKTEIASTSSAGISAAETEEKK
jgi:hypothetical protein